MAAPTTGLRLNSPTIGCTPPQLQCEPERLLPIFLSDEIPDSYRFQVSISQLLASLVSNKP
ncbi:unnamed protein product [Orchesella dallaii]|uniref:Uncharacterized protein n=1 Tax=Orchesella dallaii TaxID=48710 RepID=A0ABP1RZE6_9HEXA